MKMYQLFIIAVMYCSSAFAFIPAPSLIKAVQKNDLAAVKAVLNVKARIDCTSSGAHALHFASYQGYLAIAKAMLDHAVPVDITTKKTVDFVLGNHLRNDRGGVTPLMLAAYKGHLALVKLFLDTGAQVNAQDDLGQTALHYAILANPLWSKRPLDNTHKEIVRLLLSKKADPLLEDHIGVSALHLYAPDADKGEEVETDDIYQTMKHAQA